MLHVKTFKVPNTYILFGDVIFISAVLQGPVDEEGIRFIVGLWPTTVQEGTNPGPWLLSVQGASHDLICGVTLCLQHTSEG